MTESNQAKGQNTELTDGTAPPTQRPQEPMGWCDYICLYRGEPAPAPTSDKRSGLSRVWDWLTGWHRKTS